MLNMQAEKKGKCVIFSAPSGAGKTTIVHYLLGCGIGLEFSVSACSRQARGTEEHGRDYYFYGVDRFRELIQEDAFLEWEQVYDRMYYGTLKSEIDRIWANGHAVIFDVDVVGGLNLKKIFGDQALSIFVQPPSVEALEQRLRSRSTDPEEKIKIRVAKAREELKRAPEFDYILKNDDLETACQEARQVVNTFLKS